MSGPQSITPRNRRFPWEEPTFHAHKVMADLERNHHPREDHEDHYDVFREEDQRRTPLFKKDKPFVQQRQSNQEEFYHRRPPPLDDATCYDVRRLSPPHDGGGGGGGGGDADRRGGGFREQSKSFEYRGRSPYSPLRLPRERLPPTPRPQQREPGMGWRREEQGRAYGRFRDLSPSPKSDEQREGAGWEHGRRNPHCSYREKQRGDAHQERNPPHKRPRREMDDGSHYGYRNKDDFDEQRYSQDVPGDRFRGDPHKSLPREDIWLSGPVVVEHDHGIAHGRETTQWERFDGHREQEADFGQQRSPRRSSQDHLRPSDSRYDDRDDGRGGHLHDDRREADYHDSNIPSQQARPNTRRYGDHRERGGRFSHGRGERIGPYRNPSRLQRHSLGYQDPLQEEQRPEYRPLREDDYENPSEGQSGWAEESRSQNWRRNRPGSLERQLPNIDLDPKMPRQRMEGWNDKKTKNMAVLTEETLTIKVDMSRPVNNNSSLCYTSDRQLSLDLVNVGRQRLDFLPMLEHSGTYRETAMHTGTFAQEIITLVHQVREQYSKDNGLTLNERFSAVQNGAAGETDELTLDERFTSNRGFSLNMDSLLDSDDVPLFTKSGPLQTQPVRGPGDLRHDLERRRQERLEGVKVTISGNNMSQRPLGSASDAEYQDQDEVEPMENGGFSNWPEGQSQRGDNNMGPRRGAPYRPNSGPHHRNNRFGNRLGPMRRQNNRNNQAGPHW